jgi:hypothetical protein
MATENQMQGCDCGVLEDWRKPEEPRQLITG